MKIRKITWFVIILHVFLFLGIWANKSFVPSTSYEVGEKIDSLNGVYVYYNGSVGNVSGRNTESGYNLGLKYQCVEFVKRYYYQHLNHKMPNSYGHAKDFFHHGLEDGSLNGDRNLIQYQNPGSSKPRVNDLLVYAGHTFNTYGHVAIVSKVMESEIEVIQQNPGPQSSSRVKYALVFEDRKWRIDQNRILGWLRKDS